MPKVKELSKEETISNMLDKVKTLKASAKEMTAEAKKLEKEAKALMQEDQNESAAG